MSPEQCPICSASDLEELIALDDYPYAGNGSVRIEVAETVPLGTLTIGICNVCGALFQINPVSVMDLDDMLLRQPLPMSAQITGMETAETTRFLTNFERFVPRGAHILDIGCGTGDLLNQLTRSGFRAEGIDAHPAAVKQAREAGFIAKEGRFEAGMYEDGSFDAVIARSVLEHTIEPMHVLAAMASLLKPGGFLAIEVPNLGRVLRKSAFGGFSFHHLCYWTASTLRYALSLQGINQIGGFEESYLAVFGKKPRKGEEEVAPIPTSDEEVEHILEDVETFLERKETLAIELPKVIEKNFPGGIITFGAGAPTVDMLYYTGLDEEIKKVITSDKARIGSMLAGSRFEIESLDNIYTVEFDGVLISSERRQEELVQMLAAYRKQGGRAIRFNPEIEII